jgi:adenine-specific DNA-methyltransferase
MLENRLSLAKEFLKDTGSIFVRCDYNGNMYIRFLMDAIYGEENFRNEIILQRGLQTRKAEKRFLNKTDSLFFYFKTVDKGVLAIPYTEKEHVKAYQTTLSVLRGMLDKHEIKKIEQIIYETLWMPFLSMPGEQKTIQYREIFGVKLYPPKEGIGHSLRRTLISRSETGQLGLNVIIASTSFHTKTISTSGGNVLDADGAIL